MNVWGYIGVYGGVYACGVSALALSARSMADLATGLGLGHGYAREGGILQSERRRRALSTCWCLPVCMLSSARKIPFHSTLPAPTTLTVGTGRGGEGLGVGLGTGGPTGKMLKVALRSPSTSPPVANPTRRGVPLLGSTR